MTATPRAAGCAKRASRVLACSVAAGDGVVWAAGCPYIERLSADDGAFRVLRAVRIPFQKPLTAESIRYPLRDIAIGEGAFWVLGDSVDRRLWRVDERTGEIAVGDLDFRLHRVRSPSARAASGSPGRSTTSSPASSREAAGSRGSSPSAEARRAWRSALGGVWVANGLDRNGLATRPETGEVVATIHVDGVPREIAVGAGSVWVTADAG